MQCRKKHLVKINLNKCALCKLDKIVKTLVSRDIRETGEIMQSIEAVILSFKRDQTQLVCRKHRTNCKGYPSIPWHSLLMGQCGGWDCCSPLLKCNQYLKGHNSLKSLFEGVLQKKWHSCNASNAISIDIFQDGIQFSTGTARWTTLSEVYLKNARAIYWCFGLKTPNMPSQYQRHQSDTK